MSKENHALNASKKEKIVDFSDLERTCPDWPTHKHSPEFWEALGRSVATFGYLENTLLKAIIAITGSEEIVEGKDADEEVAKWGDQLLKAASDPLGRLVNAYKKAIENNPKFPTPNVDQILTELRKACEWRNILCHASWAPPDPQGRSMPIFINNKGQVAGSLIDVALLADLRKGTVELICDIINSVTSQGVQWLGLEAQEPEGDQPLLP